MTSWREDTSQDVQDDLDGLLEAVLPLAREALGRRGELLPFAAVVDTRGATSVLAADPGLGDRPTPQQVLEAVYAAAVAGAGSRRAVAVVADVWTMSGDAVRVELEHREGLSLVALLHYSRARFTRRPTFGALTTSPGEPRIWPPPAVDS